MSIRPYEDRDLEAVVRVWYEASKVGHPFLSEEQLASDRLEIIEKYIPIAQQWIYEIDGKVVGFIALIDSFIGGLFVDPKFHRKGIGTALIDHVLPMYEKLTVEVFAENTLGRGFYAKYGFYPIEEYINEHSGQPAILLEIQNENEN